MKLGALQKVAVATETPARMFIVDPDTKRVLTCTQGKELYIDFLPFDSEAGRKLERSRSAAQVAKLRSGRNRSASEEDGDIVDMQVETLSTLATGWYFGDDADEFSKENVKALFANPEYAWLRRDAFVFVYDTANFIKSSSRNSSSSSSTKPAKTEG